MCIFSDLRGAERRFWSPFGAKFSQLFSQLFSRFYSLAVEELAQKIPRQTLSSLLLSQFFDVRWSETQPLSILDASDTK